jgi:small-conductance mechanosensitive channel
LAFVSILAIILVTLIITRLIVFSMNRMKRFKKDMTAIYLIRDIITYVIYFIALMVILQFFGINLAGTLLSVGIVGIAVSFAAKDIISNLFSGIILIIGKSIKVGDTIEVDGKKGYVERISLRSTIVVDDVGVKNIVPNSILTNNEYQLYKEPEIFRVDIIVGLPFNIDLENFRNYIIEKMGEYDEIADNPRPDVYAKEILFKESRVKVSFWIKDFNNKDKYKIIISNEIRKFINMGENNE